MTRRVEQPRSGSVVSEPALIIYGIPRKLAEHSKKAELKKLFIDLRRTVASVDELHLSPDQVKVSAPAEVLEEDLHQEVVIHIIGLARGCGFEVYQKLADRVSELAITFFPERMPELHKLKVVCDPHYGTDGFTEWTRSLAELSEATKGD